MLSHIQDVARKASEKLSIVRKLASTKWGARADMLRTLYLGAVRSQIEYSQPIQLYASRTALESLDRVQSQALRFITGTFRTTPTSAVEIMTNVAPLSLRRERAVLIAYERYKRAAIGTPTRNMVEGWRERHRIKMQSFMHHAVNLGAKAGLSHNRSPMRRFSPCPPWRRLPSPPILLTLKGQEGATKRRTPTAILRALAVDTIKSFPSDAIICYTDGSAMKGPDRAGYGAFIEYPDRLGPDRIAGACGLASDHSPSGRYPLPT